MPEPLRTFRIAINGGGLAGATLFHALLQHKHIDVHIFERASEFKEAGQAINITRNAYAALELIGPSAITCLERAGAVPHQESLLKLAQGPDAGELVNEIIANDGERLANIVSRASFLKQLLKSAPQEQMHASKTLESIITPEQGNGPITLRFTDGTNHETDLLIGADGIHSRVRKIILGEDDPAASPVSSGWWVVQALKPYAEMLASLPKDLHDENRPRELGWLGDRTFLYTTFLSDSKEVQFVLTGCQTAEEQLTANEWHGTVTKEQIWELYKGWPPLLAKAIEELMCSTPTQPAIFFWEHLPAHTYISPAYNICIMGDAAHATTPWQGSGGGMSIEDALILSTLLSHAPMTQSVAHQALQCYDRLRRDRTQRIVESSKGTGLILTNQDPSVGQNAGRIRAKLRPRWDFILDFDVKKHMDDAVRMMSEIVGKV